MNVVVADEGIALGLNITTVHHGQIHKYSNSQCLCICLAQNNCDYMYTIWYELFEILLWYCYNQ